MNPNDAIMGKFVAYANALKLLEKAKSVLEQKKTLDCFLSEGNLASHTRFLIGYYVMKFFREELSNENLDQETKIFCQDCLNNWIRPINLALQALEKQ